MIINKDYFLMEESEVFCSDKLEKEKMTDNIFSFLQQIRPNLGKEKEKTIEIRLLKRSDNSGSFLGTFKVTDYNQYTKNKFTEFLSKVHDINYCMYYSVYTFNPNIKPIVNGEEKSVTKIAKNNAIDTEILVADFDNISEDSFEEYYIKFIALNIEPSITIFTGHGFQCIWKLNCIYDDKRLLKKFTEILITNQFPVDNKIKDCSRLMRTPYSFNCKNPNSIIPTYIYKKTEKENKTIKTYTVENLFSTLNYKEDEDIIIKELPLEELYPMLEINSLPKPIQEMLKGFVKGKANSVLMFLTLYFRELGFSKGKIKEIISILCKQGTYPWEEDIVLKEVDRFFYNREYSAKTVYITNLKEYGFIDFQLTNNEKLKINNYIFLNLKEISSKAFVTYLQMLISIHCGKENLFSIKDIAQLVKCSERRLKPKLDELQQIGLVDKKRSYKKDGESYSYYINGFLKFTEKGFTNFNIATLRLLLKQLEFKELNETQVVICLYLKQKCYENNDMCYLTLEKIGNDLGFTKSTISKAFVRIEELNLITRAKIKITDFQYRYNYYINY